MAMLDKETKARIADYFEASDLVDLLKLAVTDIVDAFEDDIEEAIDDIEDVMGVERD
jgi:hypothetical protein